MSDIIYDIAAQAMEFRSDYYRTELISDYLTSSRPYPIYKLLGSVNVTPDNADAIQILWNRGGGYFNITGSLAEGLTATSDGQMVDADFTVLLDGKEVSVTVNVPEHISIAITVDESNGVACDLSGTPLVVTFNDQITEDGIPIDIAPQQNLVKVNWSDQQIEYQMVADEQVFYLRLSLTQSQLHRLLVSALAFDGPCSSSGGGGGGQQGNPRTAPQTQKVCASSPIPAGWIVVDDEWNPTTCGNPVDIEYNVLTLIKYDDPNAFQVNDTLWVCASAPVPTGWTVIDTRWDPTACGHPTDNVDNLVQIKRVQ